MQKTTKKKLVKLYEKTLALNENGREATDGKKDDYYWIYTMYIAATAPTLTAASTPTHKFDRHAQMMHLRALHTSFIIDSTPIVFRVIR